MERSKKRLPAGKLEKHRDAVSKIKRENEGLDSQLSELLSLLGEARDAVDADDAALALRKIDEAKVLLAGLKSKAGEITKRPRAKVSVPRELPTRPSKARKAKPRMSYPKDKPRPANPQGNPSVAEEKSIIDKIFDLVPEVLAEEVIVGNTTYDIPDEIVELAGQLDNNPAKLYAYVRDEVEYVPYYGYMKGSLWTMWEGAANDMDQAALLSDLLRASGYETRFVIGTVEVEPEYMKLVLGVNTTEEALTLLWENYVPAELSDRKILVEHTWVEAYIPYDYYRGYVMSGEGYRWVPIDPSFTPYKPKAYYPVADLDYNLTKVFNSILENTTGSIDYVVFPENTSSLLSEVTGEFRDNSDEWYAWNVGPLHEGLTWEEFDALYEPKPPEVMPDIIPSTLPYSVVVSVNYDRIPAEFVHLMKIEIVEDGETILTFNVSSVNTIGNQITIDYIPADDAIAELVNSQESLLDIPAYMLDYKPVLRVNSLPFAIGEVSTFGAKQELRITIITPSQGETVTSPLAVGNYYALAFDLGDMPPEIIKNHAALGLDGVYENLNGNLIVDHALGRTMYLSLLSYFSMTDLSNLVWAQALGVRWWRNSPGVAVLGTTFNTNYAGSIPSTVEFGYTHVDLSRNILSVQGSDRDKRNFVFMSGAASSSWEHALFESHFNATAASALNILGGAADLGVPVIHLSEGNIERIKFTDSHMEESIRAAIALGYHVFTPENALRIEDMRVQGWLVVDPQTGASAWMIGDDLGSVLNGGTANIKLATILDTESRKVSDLLSDFGKKNAFEEAVSEFNWFTERGWAPPQDAIRKVQNALSDIGMVKGMGEGGTAPTGGTIPRRGVNRNADIRDSLSDWRTVATVVKGIANDKIKTVAKKTEQEVAEIKGIRDALKNSARSVKGWITRHINRGNLDKALEAEEKFLDLDSTMDDLADVLVEKEAKVASQKTLGKMVTGLGAAVVVSDSLADIKEDIKEGRWDRVGVDMISGAFRGANSIAWDVAEIGTGWTGIAFTTGMSLFVDEKIKDATEYTKKFLDQIPSPFNKAEKVIFV